MNKMSLVSEKILCRNQTGFFLWESFHTSREEAVIYTPKPFKMEWVKLDPAEGLVTPTFQLDDRQAPLFKAAIHAYCVEQKFFTKEEVLQAENKALRERLDRAEARVDQLLDAAIVRANR